jgi:hypothetical protein
MTIAGHWIGELEGARMELFVVTSQVGAWEVQLREQAPRGGRVTRWFDAPGDAWTYATGLLAQGQWSTVPVAENA